MLRITAQQSAIGGAICNPKSPNIPGSISKAGSRNTPCRATANMDASRVCPMVCSIMLFIISTENIGSMNVCSRSAQAADLQNFRVVALQEQGDELWGEDKRADGADKQHDKRNLHRKPVCLPHAVKSPGAVVKPANRLEALPPAR